MMSPLPVRPVASQPQKMFGAQLSYAFQSMWAAGGDIIGCFRCRHEPNVTPHCIRLIWVFMKGTFSKKKFRTMYCNFGCCSKAPLLGCLFCFVRNLIAKRCMRFRSVAMQYSPSLSLSVSYFLPSSLPPFSPPHLYLSGRAGQAIQSSASCGAQMFFCA